MNLNERKALYKKTIEEFGRDIQIVIAIEEMSELTKELTKMIRGYNRRDKLIEEIGDVKIMLETIEVIFDCENEVIEQIDSKTNDPRNRERIIKRSKR